MGAGPAAPVEARLSLRILGPLSARLDGADLNLGGRRQRAVVALLVLTRTTTSCSSSTSGPSTRS